MRFGLSLPIHGELADPVLHVDLAMEAEKAGWDGYFLWDHIARKDGARHFALTDPWITLAAIAARTERVALGPMVTPLARRRPWKVAREAVALDHLSNGRAILGVGLGGHPRTEFSAFGEDGDNKRRGRKLDEALDVITGLWSGEPFTYAGEFYDIQDAHFMPKPVQSPRLPIWVAGTWRDTGERKPFRRAARYDGVFPLTPGRDMTPQDFEAVSALVASHRDTDESFDMVCGRTLDEPGIGEIEHVNAFAAAGVTWWMAGAMPSNLNRDEVRRLIRRGPPKP